MNKKTLKFLFIFFLTITSSVQSSRIPSKKSINTVKRYEKNYKFSNNEITYPKPSTEPDLTKKPKSQIRKEEARKNLNYKIL